VSLEKTYSIQSSDLSIKAEGPWKTAQQMTELFASYDWNSELALQSRLEEQEAGEICPPGLILVRQAGVFLHLCPNLDRTITIFCTQNLPRKLLGIFKITWNKLVTKENASHALALHSIPKFMADDETWLQTNINES
jgi:hypothetical protein